MDKTEILKQYLPDAAAPVIAKWIDYFQCEFKVSRNRGTKFGDYRSPFDGKGHRISVNYNLNAYAFLVTTVHEFAHLYTWDQHQHKAKPHGTEWKSNFKRMMKPFFDLEIFPPDIKRAISNYLDNPAASSCSDLTLFRALKNYDVKEALVISVEKIPANGLFKWKDGRVFRREELLRKRYRCVEVSTNRVYLFNPVAEVELVKAS
ncbi:SprT-like domain-containing protein [Mucilaginibacter arboris]|uniref:SprT domain-containing protein n=1 Tax=Mucilaginibacter arboris TaxID=2682090 RepID=A0A7K1SRK3_9SPHI|nr:SprT-like domain-containing protein [Mucilaginibacter arboris]MVN19956.1 sprT domain-containing protein [Mucilaginibacter arboris]